jgi:hypothetical protein
MIPSIPQSSGAFTTPILLNPSQVPGIVEGTVRSTRPQEQSKQDKIYQV